eukprot:4105082-Amphidinium_carterae.1
MLLMLVDLGHSFGRVMKRTLVSKICAGPLVGLHCGREVIDECREEIVAAGSDVGEYEDRPYDGL